MSNTQMPENGLINRSKKERQVAAKLANKAGYSTRVANGVVYTESGQPRIKIGKSVGLPGQLKHFAEKHRDGITGDIHLPVVHLKNEQVKDERGMREPVGDDFIRAAYEAGMVVLGGKHMLDRKLFPILHRTFPKAVDGAAYIRGLGAPSVGDGIMDDIVFELRDITSTNDKGQTIHAGADGSGRIHPSHPLFERIKCDPCTVQIRIWNPIETERHEDGIFTKGILVPDDRCEDENGQPAIWIDWLQVKGKYKDLGKARCGLNSGAFNSDGVLVKPELLKKHKVSHGFTLSVLHKWDREGTFKWCFEILERVADNTANRQRVVEFIREDLQNLEDKGGLYGILEAKAKDDEKLQLFVQLCNKLSESMGVAVDPLKIPYVYNYIQDEMQRRLYTLRQGAGKRSLRYVAVIDNAIPRGHVVIGHIHHNGEWRFNHGDEIASTRFPMILPQALKTLKVIDPRKRGYGHLSHLLVKTHRGAQVTPWTVYFNEYDLVDGMQGDDDGDQVLIDYDPRVVAMFKDRIAMIPGTEDQTFLIEPGKAASSWKSKVPLCEEVPYGTPGSFVAYNRSYRVPKLALEILGKDGRGPVGQLTYYCSMFLALNMRMHALACGVLIQEAIDAAKHIIINSDPSKLINPDNWVCTNGKWSPVDCKSEGEWDDENGHLSMEKFGAWASQATGGAKMSDVLTWKVDGKKVRDADIGVQTSERGENLVHFCAKAFSTLYDAWLKDNVTDSPEVDLGSSIPSMLGLPVKTLHPNSKPYRALLDGTGMSKFGKALSTIMNQDLEPEDRNAKIEAEYALLAENLRATSIEHLLTIWSTELAVAESKRKLNEDCKSNINRAFRAVVFQGSPVLQALGIEMPFPCDYLSGAKLNAFFGRLEKAVADGRERDILHAVAGWSMYAEDHESLDGIPAHECKHCASVLQSKAVNHVRTNRDKRGGRDKFVVRVAEVCTSINRVIRR